MLFLPLSGVLIAHLGWQMALIVLGAVHLAIAMPLHGLLVRCCPEDLGLFPDGTLAPAASSSALLGGVTPEQAFRSLPFWVLTASLVLITASGDVLLVHQVAALISWGYDAEGPATLVGVLGLTRLRGRYLFNMLSERIAPQTLLGVGVCMQAIGVIVLLSAPNLGWVIVYLILYGAAYGAISPLGASIMAEHLGRRAYGTITAIQGIAITFCSALAILGAGWLYDRAGNYTLTFWLCAAALGLAALSLFLTPLPEK